MSARPMRLLGVLLGLVLSACSVELQHDLTEDDANDIYVLLQRNGIEAKKLKEEGGNVPKYIISVGKQDVADAAQLLRDYALPRPYVDGLGVFKKMKGMIPTQTEERAMFIEALGGEISNSLNRIPGVLEARVIVMIPETNDLTQPEKKPMPSVSVFIKYRPTLEDKAPVSEVEVKEFVATAVPELNKNAVTVLMKRAGAVEAEQSPETRNQTVMGLRMPKTSADQFKVVVGLGALLMLAMAGLTVFAFIRKPSGSGNGTRPRTKTNTGASAGEREG
jgi:type III secretion protein J